MIEFTKEVYSLRELAVLFGLNPTTLAVNVTRRPESLPKPIRIGRQIRFTRQAIQEFIDAQL